MESASNAKKIAIGLQRLSRKAQNGFQLKQFNTLNFVKGTAYYRLGKTLIVSEAIHLNQLLDSQPPNHHL